MMTDRPRLQFSDARRTQMLGAYPTARDAVNLHPQKGECT
jgi:hypothetical protein